MMLNELQPNTNHYFPIIRCIQPLCSCFHRDRYTVVSLYLASDGQCRGKGFELVLII